MTTNKLFWKYGALALAAHFVRRYAACQQLTIRWVSLGIVHLALKPLLKVLYGKPLSIIRGLIVLPVHYKCSNIAIKTRVQFVCAYSCFQNTIHIFNTALISCGSMPGRRLPSSTPHIHFVTWLYSASAASSGLSATQHPLILRKVIAGALFGDVPLAGVRSTVQYV